MRFHWLCMALPLALFACKPNEDSAKADKDKSEKSDKKDVKDKKGDKDKKADQDKKSDDKALKADDKKAGKAADDKAADKPPTADTGAPTPPASDKTDRATDLPAYSFDKIKKLDDSCTNPWVILANAPESMGADYEWKWTTQALLANLEFHTTASEPAAQWQVTFEVHQFDASMANAYVLLAHCHDGYTCNNLAAMYTAAVKSSHPQLMCGAPPSNLGPALKRFDLLQGGPEHNLPSTDDPISLCARISACTAVAKPTDAEDVGIACQKAPASFKTSCATQFPCSSVMSCLGK